MATYEITIDKFVKEEKFNPPLKVERINDGSMSGFWKQGSGSDPTKAYLGLGYFYIRGIYPKLGDNIILNVDATTDAFDQIIASKSPYQFMINLWVPFNVVPNRQTEDIQFIGTKFKALNEEIVRRLLAREKFTLKFTLEAKTFGLALDSFEPSDDSSITDLQFLPSIKIGIKPVKSISIGNEVTNLTIDGHQYSFSNDITITQQEVQDFVNAHITWGPGQNAPGNIDTTAKLKGFLLTYDLDSALIDESFTNATVVFDSSVADTLNGGTSNVDFPNVPTINPSKFVTEQEVTDYIDANINWSGDSGNLDVTKWPASHPRTKLYIADLHMVSGTEYTFTVQADSGYTINGVASVDYKHIVKAGFTLPDSFDELAPAYINLPATSGSRTYQIPIIGENDISWYSDEYSRDVYSYLSKDDITFKRASMNGTKYSFYKNKLYEGVDGDNGLNVYDIDGISLPNEKVAYIGRDIDGFEIISFWEFENDLYFQILGKRFNRKSVEKFDGTTITMVGGSTDYLSNIKKVIREGTNYIFFEADGIYRSSNLTDKGTLIKNNSTGFNIFHAFDNGDYLEYKINSSGLTIVKDNYINSSRIEKTYTNITAGYVFMWKDNLYVNTTTKPYIGK